jgi:hypothetical protein
MNTNDVERRLEALAAQSADPAVPKTLFDRLAVLEVDSPAATASWKIGSGPSTGHSHASRAKGVTALGLAAAFMLAGSLMYMAGGLHVDPKPSQSPHPTGPAPTSTGVAGISDWYNPGNPLTLGSWTKVHTFTGALDQYRNVSLSWQDGMIVGLADGWDAGWRNTCVLVSKDNGHSWTCSELPRPGTCSGSRDNCIIPGAVGVRNGRWIAVAQLDPALVEGNYTRLQTWTSGDGIHWNEQVGARFDIGTLYPEYPGVPYIQIVPTAWGFILAGYRYPASTSATPSALWTTTDGMSWQPVTVKGSGPLGRVQVDGDSTSGYVAFGYCQVRTPTTNLSGQLDPGSHVCAAQSNDGLNWTMTDPLGSLPTDVAESIQPATASGISRYAGRWVMPLAYDPSSHVRAYYEASSANGISWRVQRINIRPNEESSTLYVCSRGPNGWVAFGQDLDQYFYPSIYWSPNGFVAERIGPAPEPTGPRYAAHAIVRTPTGIVVILYRDPTGMNDPNQGLTLTAWYAPIT